MPSILTPLVSMIHQEFERSGLSEIPEDKYAVDVLEVPKAIPAPKESLEAIKGAVKGKALAKMKKEAVDCPVKAKRVSFIECFTCPNFNRRVRGKVGCAGLPLTSAA